MKVLVTGGAGFIGSHVVKRLLADRHTVTILDSLAPQVHGAERTPPAHLPAQATLVVGDVRDRPLVDKLVADTDAIIHLAAAVGLAQSMYEMERFVDVNCRGTAILLEAAVRKGSSVRSFLVASSMSLYGEGRCRCATHGDFDPALRPNDQLARGDFEIHCPTCNAIATPVPTPESARLAPTTVYAVTKRDQEELVLIAGAAYRLHCAAFRLFNVYGPHQSLSNPYTGVGAIFSSRLLNGQPPLVFEDGLQTRDFTHVSDVAEVFARGLHTPAINGHAYNVGAGRAYTLLALGELLGQKLRRPFVPDITRRFREGDIRHCSADSTALSQAMGFAPQIDFREGVADLIAWAEKQRAIDALPQAMAELEKHGLLR